MAKNKNCDNCEDKSCKKCTNRKISADKRKATNLIKYGSEMPLNTKNNEINLKRKETMIERHGAEFAMQLVSFKEHMVKLFGVENVSSLDSIKLKKEETCFENYGVRNPMCSPELREKMNNTNIERYGVPNVSQNEEIHNRAQKTRFKTNQYNENLSYKGSYELHFIEYCEANNISIQNGLRFEYYLDNKKHYYFSDFFIPFHNLIIEIKSQYTYDIEMKLNLIKEKSALAHGYNYIFIIDKNYDKFMEILA